jgi:hypothetical protein
MKNNPRNHDKALETDTNANQHMPESRCAENGSLGERFVDRRACACCEKGVLYYTETGSEEVNCNHEDDG